ncbi:hypothetical protein LDENG_00057600 [Lucifuga dentata]|nr:hypothetical protein LDENG_00057600 [Lucifuga dentata]
MAENDTSGISVNLLSETAKAVSRGIIISFSAHLKRKQKAEQQSLEQQLTKLQRDFDSNPSESLRQQIDVTAAALDTLLSSEAQRSLLFARQRIYEFGNKPSKYLANMIKKKSDSQAIPVIKDELGRRVHRSKDINGRFKSFF